MKIDEFYREVGGDYTEVLSRLVSDKLVLKFVLKFEKDESYTLLQEAMTKKDFDTAFRAAHTLKGVCSTLGFQNLFTISSQLTEALRNRDEIDINEAILLFEKLQPAYFNTIKLINCIE